MTWLDKAMQSGRYHAVQNEAPERLDEILPAVAEWLKTHQWNDETQEWDDK